MGRFAESNFSSGAVSFRLDGTDRLFFRVVLELGDAGFFVLVTLSVLDRDEAGSLSILLLLLFFLGVFLFCFVAPKSDSTLSLTGCCFFVLWVAFVVFVLPAIIVALSIGFSFIFFWAMLLLLLLVSLIIVTDDMGNPAAPSADFDRLTSRDAGARRSTAASSRANADAAAALAADAAILV